MTGALAEVLPHVAAMPRVAADDLGYITEWVVGAAMLTTALGVVGQRVLARRSIGIQVTLVALVTVVTALAAIGVISYRMLDVGDRDVMLELMGIAGLAGLAVALVIGRSVTRATRRLLGAVRAGRRQRHLHAAPGRAADRARRALARARRGARPAGPRPGPRAGPGGEPARAGRLGKP